MDVPWLSAAHDEARQAASELAASIKAGEDVTFAWPMCFQSGRLLVDARGGASAWMLGSSRCSILPPLPQEGLSSCDMLNEIACAS